MTTTMVLEADSAVGRWTRLSRKWRRRLPVLVVFAMLVMAIVVLCAVTGTLLTPKDPDVQILGDRAAAPGGGYLLGTDALGRDVLSRVIAGARSALIGPALIALGTMVLSCMLGLVSGYFGKWVDAAIMRSVDFLLAFPNLLIILVVGGIMGGGYYLAVGLMILFVAPHGIRLVRGAVLQQRGLPYVEAVESLGVGRARVMFTHLLPNVAPLAGAFAFLAFAVGLVGMSSLSFLGIGVPPGTADWGRMLTESRMLVGLNPAAALAPGIAIVLTAASMNVFGDWLMERFDADDKE